MKYAVLILSTTLILSTNYGVQAQESVSSGSNLVLVKGDSTAATPTCSFISATVLRPIPIVQGLLFVQRGDSPDRVEAKMGFLPDQPYANGVLQWTAMKGGNYVKAVVNFRNDGALTRSFTMVTKYKQPNEKQCQWEVREEQELQENSSFQSLMPNLPVNLPNQLNTSRNGTTLRGTLSGGNVSYPQGSRIYTNGIISNPRGQRTLPSASIKHGDGSTSYYYRDGSHITIDGNTVPPTGTLLR